MHSAEQILYEGRGGLEDTEQADADTAAVPALSETGPDLKYVSSPAKGGGAAGSLVGGSLKEGLLPVAPVTGAPNERWRSGGLYFRAVLTACVSIGVAFVSYMPLQSPADLPQLCIRIRSHSISHTV